MGGGGIMKFWFFCKHPAKRLYVLKKETITPSGNGLDFNIVTYHLKCGDCGADLDISYADMIGGVEGFMKRGKPAEPPAAANG